MFLNPNFTAHDRIPTLDWLARFAAAVEARRHSVSRFDPSSSALTLKGGAEFDVVHVFSPCDPETWSVLRKFGSRIVVTPSLRPEPGLANRRGLAEILARFGRAIVQGRWPPVDYAGFYSCADHYLVASQNWIQILLGRWNVAGDKISPLSAGPTEAAEQASAVYLALGKTVAR